MTAADPATAFLAAIRSRDTAALANCLQPDAVLRALTPHRLREVLGAEAIAVQYANWLEPLLEYAVLDADATVVADRVRIRYRFRGRDPEKGWQENEHTAYAALTDARIAALNLSCAGFRPVEPPR